jgi:hypothetical protein
MCLTFKTLSSKNFSFVYKSEACASFKNLKGRHVPYL